MRVLPLILAKSDSKRLPNKSIKDFCGKPMFVWNLEKALQVFGECYVSSDSRKILRIARRNGAKAIKRPKYLCGETPNIPCYQHAFRQMDNPHAIVAIQANSPTLDVELLIKTREIMALGVDELMSCHALTQSDNYHEQGAKIYGSIWAITAKRLKHYPDPLKPKPDVLIVDNSVDIHTQEEFDAAVKQWRAMYR